MKKGKIKIFRKGFKEYYLLVVSIIVLTLAIQTIIQYSLSKQRSTAMLVNLAGRQRMLSQRLLNETYSCRYHNCDYAELKLTLNKLYQMNTFLQEGNESLGIGKLKNEEILKNFIKLEPHMYWFKGSLDDLDDIKTVAFNDMRYHVDRSLAIMDEIVLQFQKKSESDIHVMRIIEMELAIFSVLIVLFEIFFIVNPIINRIMQQKKKLAEIAWHQSQVFSSHMKNIKELRYVFKIEKDIEKQKEIFGFLLEELDYLDGVSKNMTEVLKEENETKEKTYDKLINRVGNIFNNYNSLVQKKLNRDDKVHPVKL